MEKWGGNIMTLFIGAIIGVLVTILVSELLKKSWRIQAGENREGTATHNRIYQISS